MTCFFHLPISNLSAHKVHIDKGLYNKRIKPDLVIFRNYLGLCYSIKYFSYFIKMIKLSDIDLLSMLKGKDNVNIVTDCFVELNISVIESCNLFFCCAFFSCFITFLAKVRH